MTADLCPVADRVFAFACGVVGLVCFVLGAFTARLWR